MEKIIIAALAENRVIGNHGKLPWKISEDLKHFKELITGHSVIMGRKTWESIGSRPLPGRKNFVLTRHPNELAYGNTFSSLEKGFENLELMNLEKVFVIGGAEVYEQALPLVDKLELTFVYGSPKGDALFPLVDWNEWNRERFQLKEGYAFATYTRGGKMSRGLFITFESCEGGGKSTQIKELVNRIKGNGIEVVQTREPGGTQLGEEIRDVLQNRQYNHSMDGLAELHLFCAARAQLCYQTINPALEKGNFVVSDRYYDSTTAYQGFGRGIHLDKILKMNESFSVPDLTLILDIDPVVGLQRVGSRGEALTRIEKEELDFHYRVRDGYHFIANKFPERAVLINAEQTLEKVTEDIWAVYLDRLDLSL